MELHSGNMNVSKKETSFLSEHSVEFIIVPRILELLSSNFLNVIPIRFQSTREGSRISKQLYMAKRVSVISVFARRPKVSEPGAKTILIKFNKQLFTYAQMAHGLNIPVLAGVPLISSILDFNRDCKIIWFNFTSPGTLDHTDALLRLDIETGQVIETSNCTNIKVTNDLLKVINPSLSQVSWNDAIDIMRSLRQSLAHEQHHFMGVPYQPFYLITPEKD